MDQRGREENPYLFIWLFKPHKCTRRKAMNIKQELKSHTKAELLELIEALQTEIHALTNWRSAKLADDALRGKSKALREARREKDNE